MEIPWKEPWVAVSATAADPLLAELKKEVGTGHPLSSLEYTVVGRRVDRDDVLLFFPEEVLPYAVAHLTWSGKTEAGFPSTEFFRTAYEAFEATD